MTSDTTNSAFARLFHWHEGRAALRMVVAAMLTYAIAHFSKLPGAYSGVITTIIVARSDSTGTLMASLDRLAATLVGAGLACVASFARIWSVPELVLIPATLAPLAIVAAHKASYRTSMMSAMIVLSVATIGGDPIRMALLRTGEVAMGAVVGSLVSIMVIPSRLEAVTRRAAADIIPGFGVLAGALAWPGSVSDKLREQTDLKTRQNLRMLSVRLRNRKPKKGINVPGLILRGLSRINADLAFLQRELERGDDTPEQAEAIRNLLGAFHHWAEAAGRSVATGQPAPPFESIREAARAAYAGLSDSPGLRFLAEAFVSDVGDLAKGLALARPAAAQSAAAK
jgi:hypothetical protein